MANTPDPSESVQVDIIHLDDKIVHHTKLPRTSLSDILDAFVDRCGSITSWLWIVTVAVILYSVISRYIFGQGSVFLEEIQWHLAGAAWLVGLSYTMVHDAHVRADVLHERLSIRAQAWVELLGITLLLIPFLVMALIETMPYAISSFEQGERSQAPNGLPWRWILKSFLPLSMGLLLIATVSRLAKTTACLFRFPRPLTNNESPSSPGS